jgi:hypothetical protein
MKDALILLAITQIHVALCNVLFQCRADLDDPEPAAYITDSKVS